MSNTYVSDMGACTEGKICVECRATATECIEWEYSEGYRFWECFCLPCFNAALDAHNAQAETPEYKAQAEADRAASEAELAYYREREANGYREYVSEQLAELAAHIQRVEAMQPIPAFWAGLDTAGEF